MNRCSGSKLGAEGNSNTWGRLCLALEQVLLERVFREEEQGEPS